ncbi:chymotrypsinogen B-like [Watersipora subatra]|uniref:chymotrypsinogen B-like n=1 Tax=Watersipora subatra TaxID=2589382 RepID=UPI00355B2E1A
MSNNERCCMTSQITSGKENCDNYGGQCANQNNYRCNNGEFKLLGSNNELLCSAWSTNNERCCMAASPIVGTATTRAPSSVNTSVKPALNDATTTCGIQKVSGFKKRVIGGNVADKGEWPWQVSIIKSTSFYGRSFSHTCGGTIISPEWIVSAAHCFQGLTSSYNIRMRVGEHSQYVDEGTEYNAVVSKIMVHPQYSYSQNYNDIALVKLSKPLDITQKYIRAACLPSMDEISDFYNNDECYTTGWGKTSSAGSVSPILREVQSSLVSQSSCRRKWGSQIDSTKVCFGNGYKGACQGDSGGPLVCKKNGRYSLVGAVSFGSKSCTDPYVPTVYTSVAFYKSWIDQVMASN